MHLQQCYTWFQTGRSGEYTEEQGCSSEGSQQAGKMAWCEFHVVEVEQADSVCPCDEGGQLHPELYLQDQKVYSCVLFWLPNTSQILTYYKSPWWTRKMVMVLIVMVMMICEERLRDLCLDSLQKRKERVDFVAVYTYLNRGYRKDSLFFWQGTVEGKAAVDMIYNKKKKKNSGQT